MPALEQPELMDSSAERLRPAAVPRFSPCCLCIHQVWPPNVTSCTPQCRQSFQLAALSHQGILLTVSQARLFWCAPWAWMAWQMVAGPRGPRGPRPAGTRCCHCGRDHCSARCAPTPNQHLGVIRASGTRDCCECRCRQTPEQKFVRVRKPRPSRHHAGRKHSLAKQSKSQVMFDRAQAKEGMC